MRSKINLYSTSTGLNTNQAPTLILDRFKNIKSLYLSVFFKGSSLGFSFWYTVYVNFLISQVFLLLHAVFGPLFLQNINYFILNKRISLTYIFLIKYQIVLLNSPSPRAVFFV